MVESINVFNDVFDHNDQIQDLVNNINYFLDNRDGYRERILISGLEDTGKTTILNDIKNNEKIFNVSCYLFSLNETSVESIISSLNKIKENIKKNEKHIILLDNLEIIINRKEYQNKLNALLNVLHYYEANFLVIGAIRRNESLYSKKEELAINNLFEYSINLHSNNSFTKVKIFHKLNNETTKLEFKEPLDEYVLAKMFNDLSIRNIKKILDDIKLNYGTNEISEEMIIHSFLNIKEREYIKNTSKSLYKATYEAGKAIVARYYKDYLTIRTLRAPWINFSTYITINDEITNDKSIKYYEVLLAGNSALNLLYNTSFEGAEQDLVSARRGLTTLISKYGYLGAHNIVFDALYMHNSESKRKEIDKLVDDRLILLNKDARDILSNNRNLLKKLSNELLIKEHMTKLEVEEFFSKNNF